MVIEIDQSGKLEQLDTGTAIAYANGKSDVVWVTAKTKRELINYLRRTLIPTKDSWPILFAVLIYTTIEKLPKNVVLKIDEEYTGKEKIISETLEKLLGRKFAKKWDGKIHFGLIGKHSPAHKLSWEVHRKKNRQRVRSIKFEEVVKFFK